MYFKNLNSAPDIEEEYLAFKKEGNYWFPHAFKYVVWFIVVSIICVSSVVLIYYGMSFGMIKTYLWLIGLVGSFFIGVFIVTPVRILFLSLFDSLFLKKKPVVIKRKVLLSFLSNPDNPAKRKEVENWRKYNKNLYTPKHPSELQNRLEDIKYNLELRNLTVDVIAYIFFMMTVFYVVLINKTDMGFYSTQVIENLVINASYTNSIPFTKVTTYSTFLEYLNETLLLSLLLNYKEYNKVWGTSEKNFLLFSDHPLKTKPNYGFSANKNLSDSKKRQILNDFDYLYFEENEKNETTIFDKGWTMDPCVKLIGKPRFRQIRVKSDSCKQIMHLKGRNLECAAELNYFNEDRDDYSLEWDPPPSKGLSPQQAEPWKHKTGWETKSLPIYAQFSSYPSGGYILNLARNIEDSRIILSFLDAFQWIDARTRAVFIEFTTYCTNTNLFNVVTLIAEKSATGYIIPSFQIQTCKFMFLLFEVEVISIVMAVLFGLLLFFFLLRESLRIHRTSFKIYLKRAFAVLDLSIVVLGSLSVGFIILRNIYVGYLLEELEKSNNNDFVSFAYAASWHMISVYIEALLVCLASFKLFRLLMFRVVFFHLQTTLTQCYKHFIDLVLQIFALIIAFALFFHLVLLEYAYGFSNFALSLSTIIGRSVALDDSFDFSVFNASPWYLAPFFFGVFVIIITILFVNLFIAVICLYFHEIRKISLVDKYNVLKYLKHVITADKKSDILKLRTNRAFPKANSGSLWLRGGGNLNSKRRKNAKTKMKKEKKKFKANDKQKKKERKKEKKKISMKEFVFEKPYEIIIEQSLALDRSFAMKSFTSAILSGDKKMQEIKRENAIKGLFVAIVSGRRKFMESEEKYFFVSKKSEIDVVEREKLHKMKKVVEDLAKEKNWVLEESS